jgi:cyanophycinase-like exopeptidase
VAEGSGAVVRRRSAPDGVTVVGIDEHTAVVTDDHVTYEVYGRGTVVRVDDGAVFGPGDTIRV